MNAINTSTPVRRLFAAAIFGALAAGFTGLSAAADGNIERSVTVKFGDLNLSNPQGASALYSRIVAAAHQVCDAPVDLASMAKAKACLNKAISDAVTRVGHPNLIAVYDAKNPHPLPVTVAAR